MSTKLCNASFLEDTCIHLHINMKEAEFFLRKGFEDITIEQKNKRAFKIIYLAVIAPF
jgi:hypothetical protein